MPIPKEVPTSTEVKQLWEARSADLNRQYSPEEIERVGLIYYMGGADILDLVRIRLHTLPRAKHSAWLDSIYHECNAPEVEPTEVGQLWENRCADLNLKNPPEEFKQIGLPYFWAGADILGLIRSRLHTIPQAKQSAWLDAIYDECNNKLGAAFPAG